ncbi:hypothetical protein E2C01_082493 [Portunus trituberculatus]|uniref:Endonuclease/exonuclease/phosphatase domain-containing protein n=1 Tax=Portunus trituberculatus TaxID=210409 RepID=A0A5B7IZE9_PORTR|nr:hypothetical protein [Portunus trituberculatus]
MPCDDQRSDQNVNEYVNILNDIAFLSLSSDVDSIIVGGDFNTNFSRGTAQTRALVNFINEYGFSSCCNDALSTISYSYCSKGSNVKSLIDHFLLTDNDSLLQTYTAIASVKNPSDHIAIKCVGELRKLYRAGMIASRVTFALLCSATSYGWTTGVLSKV